MDESRFNIAIVGAGQLGSRHLQGLLKSSKQFQIYVIDPNEKALSNAERLYQEAGSSKNINASYQKNLIELPDVLDLAIIATTANVRQAVIESLLEKKIVKYLILEKVVFQNSDNFLPIRDLLNKVGTKAWVNCPNRSYPFYKDLKKKLNSEIIKMVKTGNNWGLACNSIHMIDLLVFLTGQDDLRFDLEQLDNTIYPSRREGFKELRGKFSVNTGRGDILEILDQDSFEDDYPEISIVTDKMRFTIKESYGLVSADQADMNMQEHSHTFPFQSELTGYVVDQIIDTGQSDLTPYTECMQYHIPMLDAFNTHFSKVTRKTVKICPIT